MTNRTLQIWRNFRLKRVSFHDALFNAVDSALTGESPARNRFETPEKGLSEII